MSFTPRARNLAGETQRRRGVGDHATATRYGAGRLPAGRLVAERDRSATGAVVIQFPVRPRPPRGRPRSAPVAPRRVSRAQVPAVRTGSAGAPRSGRRVAGVVGRRGPRGQSTSLRLTRRGRLVFTVLGFLTLALLALYLA